MKMHSTRFTFMQEWHVSIILQGQCKVNGSGLICSFHVANRYQMIPNPNPNPVFYRIMFELIFLIFEAFDV